VYFVVFRDHFYRQNLWVTVLMPPYALVRIYFILVLPFFK